MDYYFDIMAKPSCPLRGFVVSADTEHLLRVEFVLKERSATLTTGEPNALHLAVRRQIETYLSGELRCFELPLCPQGTPFQQLVWARIAAIPFGKTITYGEIAARLGDVRLARAVGQAANKNPLPLVIPCHRVVGRGGRLTGFAPGIATKAFLLDLEAGQSLC